MACVSGLTKKAEPPPTCDVNRDSGTDSANGGWLRRLVRLHFVITHFVLSTQALSTSRTKNRTTVPHCRHTSAKSEAVSGKTPRGLQLKPTLPLLVDILNPMPAAISVLLHSGQVRCICGLVVILCDASCSLTKKAEPRATCDSRIYETRSE
jgi:hypothetical protein